MIALIQRFGQVNGEANGGTEVRSRERLSLPKVLRERTSVPPFARVYAFFFVSNSY